MKLYRLTATLKAPLMVRRARQSFASATLDYLPGSSLRGALAAKFLRLPGSPEDRQFRLLFIENPARCPNLLPADQPDSVTQVLPLTAISCKRAPGFLAQGGHGVKDSLAAKTINKTTKMQIREEFWVCKRVHEKKSCCSEMTPFSGYWNGDLTDPRMSEFTMHYRRHTGIDRSTGTVASSIFFVSQAMDDFRKEASNKAEEYQPQNLVGTIYLDDEQHQVLERLLRDPLFAGSSRTRGFGEMDLSLSEIPERGLDIAEWSNKFRKRLQELSGKPLPHGTYFTINLDSHAILVDRFLRPTPELEVDFPGIKLIKRYVQPCVIRGWHSTWGMAKPDDAGVSMGSVFLFLYMGDDMEGLTNKLTELVIHGVGLRREEGYGRISLCDPLHVIEGTI